MRGFGRLLLFGLYGAGGAVAGSLCGLIVGDAAAQAFAEPMQFYHFAVVLAFMGAGIAIGTIIANAVSLDRVLPAASSSLAAAIWGSAAGVAGFVIAAELVPGSHAAAFAAVAWGAMGGFLGWTMAMLLGRYRLIPTLGRRPERGRRGRLVIVRSGGTIDRYDRGGSDARVCRSHRNHARRYPVHDVCGSCGEPEVRAIIAASPNANFRFKAALESVMFRAASLGELRNRSASTND